MASGASGDVFLVTQNIDTLHEQAGSVRLAKVHGSADRARCSQPRCHACGALMRPHVLWFDELYTSHHEYQWSKVRPACGHLRLVLAIGTSFSVGVTDLVPRSGPMKQRIFIGSSTEKLDIARAIEAPGLNSIEAIFARWRFLSGAIDASSSGLLFAAEGFHRLDARCASGGSPAGADGDEHQ